MSEKTTIARPYAKAIFEHALAQKKLGQWSEYLFVLSQAVSLPQAIDFIMNPAATNEEHAALLQAVCASQIKEEPTLAHLISLLAMNKRIMLLPEISALYEEHKAEQEKTVNVDVISFSSLSPEQQQQMVKSLSDRLQRKVVLNISVDPSLLGGAVIQAGDFVIDGSIRGKLNKLRTRLAA